LTVKPKVQNAPFRVLSLDGGGIRGLYTVAVLRRLALRYEDYRHTSTLDVGRGFDLIAGTSTGGILACALAAGIELKKAVSFYQEYGPLLFRNPVPSGSLGTLTWAARHLFRAANDVAPLKTALSDLFGTNTLKSVYERRNVALCIPTVNMATNMSWVYKTPHSPEYTRDADASLIDVCLATSAAPLYLPLATVKDATEDRHTGFFADGGLWANNPVLVGLIEAMSLAHPMQPIHVISVGTCSPPGGAALEREKGNWGVLKWKAGAYTLITSLEAQVWGYRFMATKLAESISAGGRPCRVIRLPNTSPSGEHIRHLDLDRATPKSFQILHDLARQDAEIIWLAAMKGEMEEVHGAFNSMPSLT
jgi:uncharacterized protein